MGKRGKNLQTESEMLNNKTYLDYLQRLTELALNVFEWEGLPDTIDERFLELTLFEYGYALWFKDPIIGHLALPSMIGSPLTVYREPVYRRAFAPNGYSYEGNPNDSVLIYNNYLHTPTTMTIQLFARRLYEIERAIDVNVIAQKTPTIILSDEQQRLTLQQAYMQYNGNQPFIFGDKKLDLESFKVLKTDAPYVCSDLEVLKHNIWNEALTFIGIENSNSDKKERLVTSEVQGNYGNVEAQRNVMLNGRIQGSKLVNKMFGVDINPKFKSDLPSSLNLKNVSLDALNAQNLGNQQEVADNE